MRDTVLGVVQKGPVESMLVHEANLAARAHEPALPDRVARLQGLSCYGFGSGYRQHDYGALFNTIYPRTIPLRGPGDLAFGHDQSGEEIEGQRATFV